MLTPRPELAPDWPMLGNACLLLVLTDLSCQPRTRGQVVKVGAAQTALAALARPPGENRREGFVKRKIRNDDIKTRAETFNLAFNRILQKPEHGF